MTRKTTADVDALAAELAQSRAAEDVRRADELARDRAKARHGRDRADMATEVRLAELDRAEREASATAAARLARMYREATEAGERTRIAAALARSGEARALRLERLRALNLRVLVPVLLGFAAWSTTGVQAGAVRLMDVDKTAPMWWVLWLLEPVLIGAVVWVIVARARLASAGGVMHQSADRIAAGCLTTSIMLNLVAAIPADGGGGWSTVGAMIAHAVGPVGAAATAHLIGLVDRSIGEADPWTDRKTGERVPLLAEMDLQPPAPVVARQGGAERLAEPRARRRPVVWPVERGGRRLLPLAGRCDSSEIRRGREAEPQVTDAHGECKSVVADLRQDDQDAEPWTEDRPVGIELWERIALGRARSGGNDAIADSEKTVADLPPLDPWTEDRPVGMELWNRIEPGDPETWVTDQGRVTADQVAAFLADQRAASNGRAHDVHPPAGPARPVGTGSHQIEPDQPEQPGGEDDADRVAPAAEARRLQGQSTRRQVADHIAAHPDATPAQIAAAVGRSVSTVRRHLSSLSNPDQ